ncbi:MAG: hypothetical protein IJ966_04840 [Bacilli bacterium]|nr:hypothetical protein [Bacilli bacterium]
MFNVTAQPIVNVTECAQYLSQGNLSFIEMYKKYGIIFPEDKINTNMVSNYEYITNEESTNNMDNRIVYKEFDVLSSEDSEIIVYLNYPILFKIEIDENGFYYINERFNLYVYGATQKEAENRLLESFYDQCEAFCFEEDSKLDKNAQKLKKDLLEVYKYAKKKD